MSLTRLGPLLLALVLLLEGKVFGVVGLNREELVRVYGPIREESASVYGDQFRDLLFLARSKEDGNNIIIAATMLEGHCAAVSYLKNDPQGNPAPLTVDEVRNQMVACSRQAGGIWREVRTKQWRSDSGPDVPGGLKAQWKKPELFQIFTLEMLRKSGKDW